jgi:predicted phosphate transport protein (TIGR00153 family)
MLTWFQALMPKEEAFFEHFNEHAGILVEGAHLLRQVLDGGAEVEARCSELMAREDAADAVAQRVLLAVRKTFITPFDRGDIRDLMNSMDDAIDQMQKTAKAILLFEARTFDEHMREMGDEIVEAAAVTRKAVSLLKHINRNAGELGELTYKISQLEDRSDRVYDEGMKALVRGLGKSDPMAYIAGAEIYDHLEKVMDRFEDVANRISGILTENL